MKEVKNLLILTLCLCLVVGCCSVGSAGIAYAEEYDYVENADRVGEYTSVSEISELVFGVASGTSYDTYVQQYFPDAEVLYYNSNSDVTTALLQGKVEVFLRNDPIATVIVSENPELYYIDEFIVENETGFATQKGNDAEWVALLDSYIIDYVSSDQYDIDYAKWTGMDESVKVSGNVSDLVATNGTLVFATNGEAQPFSYYKDNQLVGFDIDIIYGFCEEYGYGLEFVVVNTSSLVAGVMSGQYDLLGGGIDCTEERKESVDFLTPTFSGGVVAVLLCDMDATYTTSTTYLPNSERVPEYSSIDQLDGVAFGVATGTIQDSYTSELFPNSEVYYYNNVADLAVALSEGKIDAYIHNYSTGVSVTSELDSICFFEEAVVEENYAFATTKENDSDWLPLLDAFIEEFVTSEDGIALQTQWFDEAGATVTSNDLSLLSSENGTILFGCIPELYPYVYIQDLEIVGYDIDIMYQFCLEYGYGLEIVQTGYDSMIAGLIAGKYDILGGNITVTEERSESVNFLYPTYTAQNVVIVRCDMKATYGSESEETSTFLSPVKDFFDSLSASFTRTFVTEDRYQLILQGIGTTLTISIWAGILGSLIGFAICMMKLSKNKFARGFAQVYIRLFQGTPIVVILMIFYYIIFNASSMTAVTVAILGFGMNFGAYVSEMMRTGIEAVDNGQREAALAIGFSKTRTFFTITFPQAAKHFLPVFKGEFISLVKMTSVAGYIAIQELTKMSDIIRSRTYEAFFPLITTAIIYFIISYLLTLIISGFQLKIDPRNRKREIKGVDTSVEISGNLTVETGGVIGEKMIEVSHLKKVYSIVTPLKDVNTVINRGEVISIIGPSGTGKSTFLRCVNMLETPTEGEIFVDGKDITAKGTNIYDVRKKMGMVFQSFNLFAHLMIIENIMIGPQKLLGVDKQTAYENAMRLLMAVGLADKAYSYPDELSGGQKQRVAIARTLAMNPEIVLFDEPTSALDPTMVGEVLSVMRTLATQGLTMMIVTHEMKFARDISTRIFYMDEGVIYEEGAPKELFENPKKEKTAVFVKRLRSMVEHITSKNFDFYQINTSIEEFGRSQSLSQIQIARAQLAFEEIVLANVLKVLPNEFKLDFTLTHAEVDGSMIVAIDFDGEKYNPLETSDEISRKLLEKMFTSVEYSYQDGLNKIKIKIS